MGCNKSTGILIISYIENIVSLSNWIDRRDETFFHGWTIFYWAWWISWSPFVGMFIARISKGRTIREFLIAVLLVPSLVTSLWMGTFSGTALDQVSKGTGPLAQGISQVELTLFQMLSQLPFSGIASVLCILLILCFFVTSSDSGSLVIDSMTAGESDTPLTQRVFWAGMEGLLAIALLVGGGKDALGALQAAAISAGLPLSILLILLCVCLALGVMNEYKVSFRHKK